MAFRWDRPALMIFHPELSLFLSWNDETGHIMYMNSDKLEWAWSPIEFVGTTVTGTATDAATAGSMLVMLMARIEAGEVVVLDRSDAAPEREIRRWVGPEWSDPLEKERAEGTTAYEAWRQRCLALGSLSQVEVLDLVTSLSSASAEAVLNACVATSASAIHITCSSSMPNAETLVPRPSTTRRKRSFATGGRGHDEPVSRRRFGRAVFAP